MMIALVLNELASNMSAAAIAATSGDSDGTPWLLALGPAGAGGAYYAMWRYYRNTHQSHAFERETRIEAQPVTGNDAKVNEVKGTQRTTIDGDNHTDHRKRVQRL